MYRCLAIILALLLGFSACAAEPPASYPDQSGLDAASAIVAMHDAVMRDIIGSEYSFSELAGGDEIFVLFTDKDQRNYLMISLTAEDESRADMAVIQCYTLADFKTHGCDSLTALALPFIPESLHDSFGEWRDGIRDDITTAALKGRDVELTYYTGEFITCAASLVHTGGTDNSNDQLFTLVVSWNVPLSADDVNVLMEADTDE